MKSRAIRKFVSSRSGKMASWVAVLFVGSIAARALFHLANNLWKESLTAQDSVALVIGLLAAWACWTTYTTLIKPGYVPSSQDK